METCDFTPKCFLENDGSYRNSISPMIECDLNLSMTKRDMNLHMTEIVLNPHMIQYDLNPHMIEYDLNTNMIGCDLKPHMTEGDLNPHMIEYDLNPDIIECDFGAFGKKRTATIQSLTPEQCAAALPMNDVAPRVANSTALPHKYGFLTVSRGKTDCTLSEIKTDLRDTEPPLWVDTVLWVDTAVKLHTFQQDDHHAAKPILAHICPVWRMSDLLGNHIYKNCHELGDLINLGQSALAH